MHPISFLLKRGHLVTTAFGQKLLYDVPGMTPARFDILCFVRQRSIRLGWRSAGGSATQKDIRIATGLHESTVSKMLTRLVKLGWIHRERGCEDGRRNLVTLTALGRRKAWQAMRLLFRNRLFLRPFELIARWARPQEHVFPALAYLRDSLDLIAAAFGDHAAFYYDDGSGAPPPFFRTLPGSSTQPFELDPRMHDGRVFRARPTRTYEHWLAPLLHGAAREVADREDDAADADDYEVEADEADADEVDADEADADKVDTAEVDTKGVDADEVDTAED